VRTSSCEFSLDSLERKFVHLTNDAVQKKNDAYGKYERGNKISLAELDKWIRETRKNGQSFY
jgi:hypothetical protein